MGHEKIDGLLFAEMVRGGAVKLRANSHIIDDMNVFPIPDGDTGNNMSMTMEAGVSAISGHESTALSEVAGSLSGGMLLGARGNSGVILSQLFAGMAKKFAGMENAGVTEISEAFQEGVRQAYTAVLKPTEGTILTVAREAADYAAARIGENSTVESFFADYRAEMKRSLNRTPELLTILKEAGVLDSGGAGFVYVIDGMDRVLNGETVENTEEPFEKNDKPIDTSSFNADTEMEFGYCTELLLQLQNSKVDAVSFDVKTISEYLSGVGDSIVAFKTGTIIKIHVHTMTPYKVLQFCQQFGEFLTIKIENMMLQHNESNLSAEKEKKKPHKSVGIVAVASGEGICETFRQLGADEIVFGGQTMNPASEDFLKAFDRIDADTIIVMPNNGNVLLAARQAAQLYTKADVRVLESRTIGQGYAALSMFDPAVGGTDEIMASLTEAMQGVVTAMVSRAVRDSRLNGVPVYEGDFIGIAEKEILCDAKTEVQTAKDLLSKIDMTDKSVIISVCGKDSSLKDARQIADHISAAYPFIELFQIDGGQEVFPFLFIIE